jgi:hypothetical protein
MKFSSITINSKVKIKNYKNPSHNAESFHYGVVKFLNFYF